MYFLASIKSQTSGTLAFLAAAAFCGGHVWDKVRKILGTEILFNIANELVTDVRSALSFRIYIQGNFFEFRMLGKNPHLIF